MMPRRDMTKRCPGTLARRAFLQFGLAGWSALSLPDLLRGQARAAAAGGPVSREKSMIVVWLWGGPSHMETFDLKPEAPAEYRGEFHPIPTNVPGMEIGEHLPRLARLGDKFALIRSCHHDSPGHMNSTHTVLTAYPGQPVEVPPNLPKHPDCWAVLAKMLAARGAGVPTYAALPRKLRHIGSAYLGSGFEPFVVTGDPNANEFQVPNLALNGVTRPRFDERLDLLAQFDTLRRETDTARTMATIDEYNHKAVSLLTGDAARRAFDLDREDPRIRERYGRHEVGQRCLLARRLVEAGVRLVTVDFPCVPGQKAFSWDDHAAVWNIFEQMKIRLPVLDQVVSALIEDLYERGLDRDVMLVVMGEMSHTPRLSDNNGQPGREHWARSMSLLMSGGGLRTGQVVGATDSKGEEPIERPVTPNEVKATWYRHLGVPLDTHLLDHFGRPTPILPDGEPIRELM